MGQKTTEGKKWLDKLDATIAENSRLTLILFMLLIIVFLLILGYMRMVNKMEVNIELPKTIKESGTIVVGKDFANDVYYRMWAREDVENLSTFNPVSIKNKIKYLENRMYPPYFYKNIRTFRKYEKNIATNLISQKFTFSKDDITSKAINKHEEIVTIKGFYNKKLDDDVIIKAKKCAYQLGYLMKEGHIYVESFKTNCN